MAPPNPMLDLEPIDDRSFRLARNWELSLWSGWVEHRSLLCRNSQMVLHHLSRPTQPPRWRSLWRTPAWSADTPRAEEI